jgi:hypothetical protein
VVSTRPGPALLRCGIAGALLGLVWGVLARVWMRLISTDPEFSWTGTLLIVGFSSLLGLGVGVVHASRRAGLSRWWTLAFVPGLVLFLSPGMVLAPTFLVGGLARGQRGRVLQALGLAGLTGPIYLAWVMSGIPDPLQPVATLGERLTMVTGFALLSLGLAAAGSLLWQPRGRRQPSSAARSAPIVVSAP